MNDAATVAIAIDNVKISQYPDKWRVGQLLVLSTVLALFLAAESFATFFISRFALGATYDQLGTIMYLQMSSCPHFVIFSTRLPGFYFWERAPAPLFFAAIVGTQIIAMFFSIYGVLCVPIGWGWSTGIMAISLVYFMFLDIIKVFIYRNWSFELTATLWPTKERRQELKLRRQQRAQYDKYRVLVHKIRRYLNAAIAIYRMKNHKRLRHISVQIEKL
jgi:H+-transporting ATPase